MHERAVSSGLILLAGLFAAIVGASAAPRGFPGAAPGSCPSAIKAKDCLATPTPVALDGASPWRLVRSKGAKDSDNIVSIMKTADTQRSDPDFAGLMIRCAAQGKIDVLMVLVRPFPPQSKPQVTVGTGPASRVFEGKMAAAGAAVVLPDEAGFLAGGPWQAAPSLAISARDGDVEIKGVVGLEGLKPAYSNLVSSCTP